MAEDLTRTSPVPSGPAPISATPSRAGGRFVAGTILAGRYRIVTLLGAGGMGEVYKAEDLKLDHPVALKFLPETLSLSPAALARFHGEVRIARQVSHPNVCRVYDIGDVDGLQFLTMEFIDGEDLASLLRRIGRLPADKAVEVARQLCAGLAAAHDAGVIHRDLKPHNVMIDGRGRARVTDFGVAALAREVRQDNVVAGTPAFMAPEQLRGADATVRSDIYSLGLVLYEIFTGKRAIQVSSLADAVLHHSSTSAIAPLSSVVSDVDPMVERVILRCLEKDPGARPASAIQVAAALPGGDPLQAALAAGETPSPEMVAASGSTDAMRPGLAAGIAVAALAIVAFVGVAGARDTIQSRVMENSSRDVLAYRARETLTALGYADRGADHAFGFVRDLVFLEWDRANLTKTGRFERLSGRPAAFQFWYRESPTPLAVHHGIEPGGAPRYPELTVANPPPVRRGMRYLKLDASGRLLEFGAVPLEADGGQNPPVSMNWSRLFQLAGLDQTTFTQVAPEWTPSVAMDEQAAWSGAYPEQPDLPIRVEAASFRGRLVAFRTFGAWSSRSATQIKAQIGAMALLVSLSLLALALAAVNTRAGRGDRRGASRLAAVTFFLSFGAWILGGHHVAAAEEMDQLRLAVSLALFSGALSYVAYLAIEPLVRRRWPAVMVAWARLIAGRWRDPLVGRELLVGCATGAVLALVPYISMRVNSRAMDTDGLFSSLASMPAIAGGLLGMLQATIALSLMMTVLVLALRTLTRSTVVAGAGVVAISAAFGGVALGIPAAFTGGLIALVRVVALTRFGLVALVSAGLMSNLAEFLRGGFAEDTGIGLFVLAVVAVLVGGSVYIATGHAAPGLLRRPAPRTGG